MEILVTLSQLASCLENDFTKYYRDFMNFLNTLLNETDQEICLRMEVI